ncbi:MAG: class I SAM-dependent methyltransferase [Myxococcota bacterium]|nr:class I SAM-dependent methyltransferase [Myxococcota bacterium]
MHARDVARQLYTRRSRVYHVFVAALGYRQGLRAALRAHAPLRSGMKVLDAGCGGGLATFALREALASGGLRPGVIHGFDLTPAMLERFRAAARRRGMADVTLREADVLHLETLPEAWRGYDLVVSSAMLEYVPRSRLPDALRGLRRRLAPDGALFLFVSRRNLLMRALIGRPWRAELYTRDELAGALAEAGLGRVRFHGFPGLHRYLDLWGHVVEARA